MTPTAAEVLQTAKALPREERAEVTQELLATLGERDVAESVRLDALLAAVNKGVTDLDAGHGIAVPADGVRDYLCERGRLATERAAAKTA